jgi:hypothetical protein
VRLPRYRIERLEAVEAALGPPPPLEPTVSELAALIRAEAGKLAGRADVAADLAQFETQLAAWFAQDPAAPRRRCGSVGNRWPRPLSDAFVIVAGTLENAAAGVPDPADPDARELLRWLREHGPRLADENDKVETPEGLVRLAVLEAGLELHIKNGPGGRAPSIAREVRQAAEARP